MKKVTTLLLFTLIAMWGCGKYDLYYPAPAPGTSEIRFVPNSEVYDLFTEATVSIYQGDATYDSRTDLLDSLKFILPDGSYNVLVCASGENIKYRNLDNLSKAEAYVETSFKASKADGVLYAPNTDSLYHTVMKNFEVGPNSKTKLDVPARMLSRSRRLFMELELEKDANKVDATLSGVAISLNLSTGTPNYETVTYLTDMQPTSINKNKVTLTCTYFGVMPTPPVISPETPKHKNEVILEVEYKDGSSEETGTDITDIFDNSDPDESNDIVVTIKKVEGKFHVVNWHYSTGSGTVTGLP